ncbi:MAG: tetratricopeptide repeat protein, partial [Saprospiraceae bacterium]|nr:tetratricopeptide repeat protein [Saprospiraceae bacterium]
HQTNKKVAGAFLFQNTHSSAAEQVDACGRCHARRGPLTNEFKHEEDMMDHYIPILPEYPLYHVDGQINEEVYVYGSFLQSKMYHRSVSCMDCHDPHTNMLKFEGNDLCAQCHQKDKYDNLTHHFHPKDSEGAQCVNCHMPGKTYMGNDFRRDHSFRVPRPDLSEAYNVPNACNDCHADKDFKWASDAIVEHYGPQRSRHFSEAFAAFQTGNINAYPQIIGLISDTSNSHFVRATALDLSNTIQDEYTLSRLVSALKSEHDIMRYTALNAFANYAQEDRLKYLSPMLKDSSRAVRTQAVYLMADLSADLFKGSLQEYYAKAMDELQAKMDVQADFPQGQNYIAQFHFNRKEYRRAEQAYLKAYNLDPYDPSSQIGLANLYYRQSNIKAAEKAFLKAIEIYDASVEAHYSLGLLYAETKDLENAARYFGNAARKSQQPRHYYNWGLTLQNLGKIDEAEKVYLEALELHPQSEEVQYALSILYLNEGKNTEAKRYLENLLRLFPNNKEYRRLIIMANS